VRLASQICFDFLPVLKILQQTTKKASKKSSSVKGEFRLPKLPHFGEKLKKIPLFNEALIAIIIFR
jgi:hypothetical protein